MSSSTRRASCSASLLSTSDATAWRRVQTLLERPDHLQAASDPRHLRVEVGGHLTDPRGLLRPFIDQRHLSENRVHCRFDLRRARAERAEAFAKRFERGAVCAKLVPQLCDISVGSLEIMDLLAKALEIGPAPREALVLRDRSSGQVVHVRQTLSEPVEAGLLSGQLIGLPQKHLE